ncbi:MAG: hypothetical protein OXQ89_10020 [Rhodospirillaceae bacterium]|nr:hypothetical protein [Rhodospirillaceae bacterium]
MNDGFSHPVQHPVPVVVGVQLLGLKRESGPAPRLMSHGNEEVSAAPALVEFRSRAEPKAPGALVWKHVQHKQVSQGFLAETSSELFGETERGPSALSDAFSGSHGNHQDEGEQSVRVPSSSYPNSMDFLPAHRRRCHVPGTVCYMPGKRYRKWVALLRHAG